MRFKEASQQDLWREIRRRILNETNSYLTTALQRPEMGVSIPIVVVGKGRFGKTFSEEFWGRVLGE